MRLGTGGAGEDLPLHGLAFTVKYLEAQNAGGVNRCSDKEGGREKWVGEYAKRILHRTKTRNPFKQKGFGECTHQHSHFTPKESIQCKPYPPGP
jgi:hypothetical protein